MHILMTANAAWNIWNFRRAVVRALIADGHNVTVLAPLDDSIADIKKMGCRYLPLGMNAQGLNPVQNMLLVRRMKHVFRMERPDIILSYTIKNNIFGAIAAKACSIPFIPNVTGLGTAFLSGGMLQYIVERLYRRAFATLPIVFFQNADDQDHFITRELIQKDQARLLPGSGIDLEHFYATEFPPKTIPPTFLMISRLLRDKGVMEFAQAARLVKALSPGTRFQLLGPLGSDNRSAIDVALVRQWQRRGIIQYLGTTADVRPTIYEAHCIVLPSYREGGAKNLDGGRCHGASCDRYRCPRVSCGGG